MNLLTHLRIAVRITAFNLRATTLPFRTVGMRLAPAGACRRNRVAGIMAMIDIYDGVIGDVRDVRSDDPKMKIYSLEFVSEQTGSAERIWHTNRSALERYSKALDRSRFRVNGITSFEMPTPVSEARIIAFLNANCAGLPQPEHRAGTDGDGDRSNGAIGSS